MVYIPARDIKSSVQQAVRDHLWCHEEDKDILMKHIEQGEGIAIFLDAIDEIRDRAVLKDLKDWTNKRQTIGGPKFLVSARTAECSIDPADFNRFLVLEGFTEDQGQNYVGQYFPFTEASTVEHPAVDYVKKYKEQLKPVLCNPLKLHVFCALTYQKVLKLEEGSTFDIVNLFEALEKFLTRREGGTVSAEQSSDFYKLCLFSLLSGLREIPEELLNQFNIVKNYYAFLIKRTAIDIDAVTLSTYSFPHEMIYEFFAARCVEEMSLDCLRLLMLHVCCETSLRNTQKMMFELILKKHADTEGLLKMMIRAILILQNRKEKGKKLNNLTVLVRRIKSAFSIKELLQTQLTEDQIQEASAIWDEINVVFDQHADDLKSVSWFHDLEVNGTLNHVIDCIKVCMSQKQEGIMRDTIHRLLPCSYEEHG